MCNCFIRIKWEDRVYIFVLLYVVGSYVGFYDSFYIRWEFGFDKVFGFVDVIFGGDCDWVVENEVKNIWFIWIKGNIILCSYLLNC